MTEFIIHEDWRGWGVWVAKEDWRQCNSLAYFKTRQQAEEYEYTLQCGEYTEVQTFELVTIDYP